MPEQVNEHVEYNSPASSPHERARVLPLDEILATAIYTHANTPEWEHDSTLHTTVQNHEI